MAEIAFPTVSSSNIIIGLSWPSQVNHRSIYTGESQAITRGIGLWEGTITWSPRSVAYQEDDIREIEAFLASLEGGANTFKVPLQRDQSSAFTSGTDLMVTAAERAGSSMILTFDAQTGLVQGNYINISDELFILNSSLTGGTATVTPHRPLTIPAAGLEVSWETPFLNARRTESDAIVSPRDPEYAGPWTIGFTGA